MRWGCSSFSSTSFALDRAECEREATDTVAVLADDAHHHVGTGEPYRLAADRLHINLKGEYPVGDSNPCYRDENPAS